jgi:hypothetical protein
MIRNDGYLLLEDPDIKTTKRELPPHDSIIYLFPDPHVDARLYEWEVLIRNDANDRIFVPADPNGPDSFVLDISANQVKVTVTAPRDYSTEIQIAGHLVGDHTLLKAELRGLTSQIVFNRQPGDTTDFTTLDWILYRWRPNENREYIREDDSNYSLVKEVDKVTVTLTNPVTSWISTRLLGYTPGTGPGGDGKVKVTSNDLTPDYLLPKLQAGSNINLTEINDGGYERVEIAVTGVVTKQRFREALIGVKDHSNQVFTTSQKFTRAAGYEEWAYFNGVLQEFGAGNDYVASESGGIGTGYDTITFSVAPRAKDKLEIIYLPV